VPVENDDGEHGRHTDPGGAPRQRFFKADSVRTTMEYAQIERKHHQYEQVEQNPK
jgi:hypothetical protein